MTTSTAQGLVRLGPSGEVVELHDVLDSTCTSIRNLHFIWHVLATT